MKMLGKDGRLHEVPDGHVQAAFLSGHYGFLPGTTVPVATQDGQVGQIRAEEAQAAFGSGARIANPEEYHKAALQQEYGGLGGQAIAGAEGVARGVSVGLSDPLAIQTAKLLGGEQTGEAVRKHLQGFKEANPISAIGGEVVGTVAPAVLSGGESLAARGAVEGVEVGEAARAAELGAAERPLGLAGREVRALPEGHPIVDINPVPMAEAERSAALARVPAAPEYTYAWQEPHTMGPGGGLAEYTHPWEEPKALGMGGEPVLESPPPHAPDVMDAEVLPNEPPPPKAAPTGARPAAAGAAPPPPEGSLFSKAARAAGAPMRAVQEAGHLAEAAVNAVIGQTSERVFARAAQKALSKGVGYGVEGALYNVGAQISEDALGDHETTAEKLYAAAGHGAMAGFLLGGVVGAGGEIAKYGISKASPALRDLAETQAVRTLNPKVKNVTEITNTLPQGVNGLGRWLLDNGIVQAGDKVTDVAERLETARTEVGEKIAAVASQLDNLNVAGPDAQRMLSRMDKLIAEVRSRPGFDAIANSVQALRDSFEEKLNYDALGHLNFTKARFWRSSIDDILRIESNPLAKSPRDKELRQVRRIIEDEIEKAADRASPQLGAVYKEAKLNYRYAAAAEKIASKESDRILANRVMSPTDYLSGIGGAVTSVASGHPAGAAIGLAAGVAHHVIRERGNATVAAVLDKVADFAAMSRAAKDIDTRIEGAVEQYVNDDRPRIKGKLRPYRDIEAGEKTRDTYERKVKEVVDAAARLPKKNSRLHNLMLQIAPNAPKVARAMGTKTAAAISFLASKVPERSASASMQPQFDQPNVTDADVAKFLRYAQAVDNPMSVLDEMHRGTLTTEHVEALKTVYPNLHTQIAKRVTISLAEAEKPLPYDRMLQLRTFLEMPTTATMRPAFVQVMQKNFAVGGGKGAHASAPKRPVVGIAEGNQLSLEKSINRKR